MTRQRLVNACVIFGSDRSAYSGATCGGAQEARAGRDVATGVARRDAASLLLPAVEVARLSSELGGLLESGEAVLKEGRGTDK
jgi:hypothetical protein